MVAMAVRLVMGRGGGGAVQPMLVAVMRTTGGVAAAAGTERGIGAIRIQRALHGHGPSLILTGAPYSARVGRQFSGVDTFWVCLQFVESDIKGDNRMDSIGDGRQMVKEHIDRQRERQMDR